VLATATVSPRIHWLLLVAACCLVAQTALLPLASMSASTWTPVHRHITLNGTIPPHTHPYELPAGQAAGAPACIVTDASSGVAGTQHQESVVCAPEADGALSGAAVVVYQVPGAWQMPAAGLESAEQLVEARPWSSVPAPVLTPPPRS